MEAIQNAVKQFSKVEADLLKSLPKTDDYLINGVFDDEGYKAAKSALRAAKKQVSAIEAKRKELKQIALEYGRAVDGEANRLKALAEPVTSTLERRIASIDMERERLRNEKRDQRTKEILAAGYTFSLGAYRVGAAICHPSAIDDADDEQWAQIIASGQEQAEAERVAREKREAEVERIREEREELERIKAEIEAAKQQTEPVPTEPVPTKPTDEVKFTAEDVPQSVSPEYRKGFDAARSLAVEIIKKHTTRREMIAALTEIEP